MQPLNETPFLLLHSEAHALEKARVQTLVRIVFGLVASDPQNPHHNQSLDGTPTKKYFAIDKNKTMEASMAVPLTLPPDMIARTVEKYLDERKDSHVISREARELGNGRSAKIILAEHGLDIEDIHLEMLNVPEMQARAAAEALRFGWKPHPFSRDTRTVLYSEQHAIHLSLKNAVARIVFGVVAAKRATPGKIELADVDYLDDNATIFYRDEITGNSKEVSYAVPNFLPQRDQDMLIKAFRDKWKDARIVSRQATYSRPGRNGVDILTKHGLDEEDAHIAVRTDEKMAEYAREMAIRFSALK